MSKYVIGKKGVVENIKKNNITNVYIRHHFPELSELSENNNFNIIFKKDLSFFESFGSNHQFVIGELKNDKKIFNDFNEFIDCVNNNNSDKKVLVMLDEIQDAGNFGSIIRTSECFNVDGIIYKKNNQVQVNDVVIKTSSGAISNMNLLKTTNLINIIEKLKKNNYWIVSTSLEKDSVLLSKENLNFDKICIIFGNEQNGISKNIIKESDVKIKIPMYGTTQSLNVSVSSGIVLHTIRSK